jgi:hypothetical protein
MDHLATATPDKVGHGEQLDPGLRRALAQTLWAIDGHSRSSDTHCLFRERMLDLQRHKDKPAGSYCTRVSLYWPKEVRPGSARGNSSGKSGHWSKSFQIWSTTPTALCALAWLRAMFQENSSAAFMKVAVAGTVYTPAWHSHKKTNGVFSVNAPATVATDVAAVMTAAGCRQGETAHQLRGEAVTEPAWKRADVPFAVIADGHRRYVHFQDEEDALTQQRWC